MFQPDRAEDQGRRRGPDKVDGGSPPLHHGPTFSFLSFIVCKISIIERTSSRTTKIILNLLTVTGSTRPRGEFIVIRNESTVSYW